MNTIPQPSTKSLIWSCISSFVLATIIFLVAVLPAEFNIDPTGLGKKLGLSVLSLTDEKTEKVVIVSCPEVMNTPLIKKTEANKLVNDDHEQGDGLNHAELWQDTVVISIPPGKGLEYKFFISKGEKFEFVWATGGTAIYFDFHGEPEGNKTGYFKSFKESTKSQSSGTLLVPFSGSHGWYWKNKTNQTINITLKTSGDYKIIGLI